MYMYTNEESFSLEDLQHYCHIAMALKKTIEIQEEIGGTYPKIEEETITFIRQMQGSVHK